MPGVEPWALWYGLHLSSHAEAVPTQPQHPEAAISFSVRKTLHRGCPSDWVQDSDALTASYHTGASSILPLVDPTWVSVVQGAASSGQKGAARRRGWRGKLGSHRSLDDHSLAWDPFESSKQSCC